MAKNNINEYEKFCGYLSQSVKTTKAITAGQRLATLNSLVDAHIGKAVKSLLKAKVVMKCSSTFIGTTSAQKGNKLDQYYGHLIIDNDKYIRVSTCLNKEKRTVQVPISEKQYWNDKTYLYFTTGDLFLLAKTSDLEKCYCQNTELQNYEFSIPEMFMSKSIHKYGIVNDLGFMVSGSNGNVVDLTQVSLPKKFGDFKIKGCVSTFKPKYVLQDISGSNSYSEYYTTIDGIFKTHKKIEFSPQYINKIAKYNSSVLLDGYTYNTDEEDDYRHKARTLVIDGKEYIVVSLKNNLTLEVFNEITDVCRNRIETKIRNDYDRLDREISVEEAMNYIVDNIPDDAKVNRKTLQKSLSKVRELFGNKLSYNICAQAMELNQIKYGG